MEARTHPYASKSTRFPPGLPCLGSFSNLFPPFTSRSNRLWTRCRLTYSHRSMAQSPPLIYWTRLRVESQRLKVPRTGPIPNAQPAPKSSNSLGVEPGKAPPLLESPKNRVKTRNRERSSGRRAASTEEGHCIVSPAWISSPKENTTRRTTSKITKVSIGRYRCLHRGFSTN